MTSIKGFIFDLDGVLVDTAKYHFKAWHGIADELNIGFTHEQNEELKGISRRESLLKILQWGNLELTDSEIENWMKKKNEHYLREIENMDEDELLPGVKKFLEEARTAGLKIALGSASKNAQFILEKTGIEKFFEAVIDGNKTNKSKPHPQVFLLGAQALHLEPENIVVFEDAVAGIEAAEKGGFRRVGIGNADVLGKAEVVLTGLADHSPMSVINKLNFKE